jgi:DNA helicase-2/ATP-dependent DNA helicase PcrA
VCPVENGRVLIIGDSTNPTGQRQVASQTFGAVTVEAVDLRDLVDFCSSFSIESASVVIDLLTFAKEVLTNLDAPLITQRLDSLRRGTARNAPTPVEFAALLPWSNLPGHLNRWKIHHLRS